MDLLQPPRLAAITDNKGFYGLGRNAAHALAM